MLHGRKLNYHSSRRVQPFQGGEHQRFCLRVHTKSCLKMAGERDDVSEECWLLIKTICRTMDNLRSRSRLWSAGT
ncbi:hypothetical protein QYF61_005059 [Mycteria americana]|uniref:Uncharacterized protein n=1 Tax=Mycteria americana TaxID=33587 RepID=A0AAN7MQC8_MYCAM|nr:hypothetical protein QYF61_005059 [Mycteria americana]